MSDEKEIQETIYRVILKVEPAVKLPRPLKVSIAGIELRIKMMIDPELKIPKGLQIATEISAESMGKAISRVRGYSNRALSLLSFLTYSGLPSILPLKCYDVTPGRRKGKFAQFEYDVPLEPISTRTVDVDTLLAGCEKLTTFSDSHQKRVMRAFHWYNLALQSEDTIDRFASLWIALEAVEPVLRNHYGLDMKYTLCPECGSKRTPLSVGSRRMFKETTGDSQLYSSMRDLRVDILHGRGAFESVIPRAMEYVPMLQEVLDKGLRILLSIGERTLEHPVNLATRHPAVVKIVATVEGPDLSLLDKNTDPAIDLEFSEIGKRFDRQEFRYDPRVTLEEGFRISQHEIFLSTHEQVGKPEIIPIDDEGFSED